ncbi:helix-turn-helix domain-containing protein [Streptomyces sp. SGAir0957]
MGKTTTAGPDTTATPPVRIVMGLYLRCLRKARRLHLETVARQVKVAISTLSRWELAEAPIPPQMVPRLLRIYGVADDQARFLERSLPEQRYSRDPDSGQGFDRSDPYGCWVDVAGAEASARRIAVMRAAETTVEFAVTVPPGLRTPAYIRCMGRSETAEFADEPVLGQHPSWVHGIDRPEEQTRTVLLDEAVLTRAELKPP